MRNVHDSHTHFLSPTNYQLIIQYILIIEGLYLLQTVALLRFNDMNPVLKYPNPQLPSKFS